MENDIDEIESNVFGGSPEVSRRIYELIREVIAFRRATEPLADILAGNRQNEEVKKVSAWAAILFAPTIVGTIYG